MPFEELDVEREDVRTGEYYRTYVVGTVSVAELDDHRIFSEEADDIAADFIDKLRANPQVNATVDIVTMDEPSGDLLLETVENAAREARQHGLEKYAIVSEDITRYAMQSKVDIDGIESFTTDDPDEALRWAMDDDG